MLRSWRAAMLLGAMAGLLVGCLDKPVGGRDGASSCGDGVIDPGEICDGDCPTSCDDGDLCTADVLTGSADRCDAQCTFEPISTCVSGDGCCPPGCHAANDDDCVPICGNGIVEPGEDCDGATGACSDVGFPSPGTVPCVDCRATDVSACCAAPAWEVQTVDSTNGGGGTSMALDAAGRHHISYTETSTGDLRYAYFDGAGWQREVVDNFAMVHEYSSLALDALGRPHISYAYPIPGQLMYAHHDGTGWQPQIIGDGTEASSLTVDAAGNPHVFYWDAAAAGNVYAHFDGAAWQSQVVDEGAGGGWSSTPLALDAAGRPHVAYYRGTLDEPDQARLWYARFDGTGWEAEIVDTTTDVRFQSSLALDTVGRPHISYVDWENGALRYAHHDGASWQLETVQTGGLAGYDNSLAVDGAHRPHIALSYNSGGQSHLRYALFDGTDWEIYDVDVVSIAGPQPSLALDVAGLPHISYRNFADRELKYARLVCP